MRGTDAGTKPPNANASSTTGAGVSAPSAGAKINSSTNAEINKNNPQGSRPGENTRKPGDMDKIALSALTPSSSNDTHRGGSRGGCLCYRSPAMPRFSASSALDRRALMRGAFCAVAAAAWPAASRAAPPGFAHWVAGFRPSALKRGVSEATYARVMNAVEPDMSVLDAVRAQPEFTEKLWQYINRRCSEWRVITGKQRAREHAALLARIERDYGVDRYLMLGLWGMESSFGDVIVNRKYMRPVIPALAALAWREPRRRALLGGRACSTR